MNQLGEAATTQDDAELTVARIAERVLEGRVVPFLGAGVSGSTHRDARGDRFLHHTSGWLERRLRIGIGQRLPRGRGDLPPGCVRPPHGGNFAQDCELLLALLEEEAGQERAAQVALCETLRIAEFRHLAASRAHRMLAFLSCEGLLSEVVTTNYDCATERAFAEAVGATFHADDTVPDGARLPGLRVTYDLQSYRKHGRGSGAARLTASDPILRVHKINGCARQLHLSPTGHASLILLTERQLQDFRERGWSRDLVRDRLRSTVIVFSGFGNAEPQIRHTVGLVMEEPAGERGPEHGSPRDLEHAIFVAGFGAEDPTFHQWQALTAVARSAQERRWRDLYVGPAEATASFRHQRKEAYAALTADDFWGEIWARVLHDRLREVFDGPGSLGARAFSGVARCASALAARLRQRLASPDGLTGELLRWSDPLRTVAFSRWLHAARWPGTVCTPGRYHPLSLHADLLGRLLVVATGVGEQGRAQAAIEGHELRARVAGLPRPVTLRADWSRTGSRTEPPGERERVLGRIRTELVVAPSGRAPTSTARVDGTARTVPVSVPALLAAHEAHTSTPEAVDRLLRHAACFPTHAFRAQQRSVRRDLERIA